MPDPKDQHDAQLLGIGKAPTELLARIFQTSTDPTVIQGPGVGKDAAIVEWGDRALVVSSDPITFIDADAEAGKLAVTVNANDIFAVGAEPEWLLATILAQPGVPARDLETLLTDLQAACAESDITLIGGHTEVTDAVTRTIISCTMIGSAPLGQIIPSDAARDGDAIIQAGAAAVEGTAILGHPELLDTPGISIATAARTLRAVEGLHAMHDVTGRRHRHRSARGSPKQPASHRRSTSITSSGCPRPWAPARSAASTRSGSSARAPCWPPSPRTPSITPSQSCPDPVCKHPASDRWPPGHPLHSDSAARWDRFRASRATRRCGHSTMPGAQHSDLAPIAFERAGR